MYAQKPYKYSIIDNTEKMRTLFDYKKYLQPPSMHGQSVLEAEWDKRNESVPEKFIRKAIIDEAVLPILRPRDCGTQIPSIPRIPARSRSMRARTTLSWRSASGPSETTDGNASSSGPSPARGRR